MTWQGVARRPLPGLPSPLRTLTNVSCLFSRATPTWNAFYVQIRTRADGPWITLDDEPGFALQPFGHRTRLHRYLVEWCGRNEPALEELAQWLMDAYAAEHPHRPALELRFLQAPQAVGHQAVTDGAWVRPPLRAIPANHLRVVSTHRWDDAP